MSDEKTIAALEDDAPVARWEKPRRGLYRAPVDEAELWNLQARPKPVRRDPELPTKPGQVPPLPT